MNKEVRMLLPKKDLIQVEYIGKINNYYEDIYKVHRGIMSHLSMEFNYELKEGH